MGLRQRPSHKSRCCAPTALHLARTLSLSPISRRLLVPRYWTLTLRYSRHNSREWSRPDGRSCCRCCPSNPPFQTANQSSSTTHRSAQPFNSFLMARGSTTHRPSSWVAHPSSRNPQTLVWYSTSRALALHFTGLFRNHTARTVFPSTVPQEHLHLQRREFTHARCL